ncbi:replication/maintenance protein RepL, partial [Escherichia coli]|nr:replication/maintenance protein RepL [Escherichia coli]
RYKENPFLEGMVVPVKGKQVRLSRLGRDDNILVNQNTGEVQGTHVTTYKRVDSEQFVKLFTANIGLTFELSSAGIKAFGVLVWSVQNSALSKDEVDLDTLVLEAFLQCQVSASKQPLRLSLATFKRGLNELEKAKIIAKTMRQGRYFINPNFVFNGDRIAFTTVIERKNTIEKQEDKSS